VPTSWNGGFGHWRSPPISRNSRGGKPSTYPLRTTPSHRAWAARCADRCPRAPAPQHHVSQCRGATRVVDVMPIIHVVPPRSPPAGPPPPRRAARRHRPRRYCGPARCLVRAIPHCSMSGRSKTAMNAPRCGLVVARAWTCARVSVPATPDPTRSCVGVRGQSGMTPCSACERHASGSPRAGVDWPAQDGRGGAPTGRSPTVPVSTRAPTAFPHIANRPGEIVIAWRTPASAAIGPQIADPRLHRHPTPELPPGGTGGVSRERCGRHHLPTSHARHSHRRYSGICPAFPLRSFPGCFPQPQPVRQHRQHVRHFVHSPSSCRLIADVRACVTARALILALVFLVIIPI